jgi:iron complex outermembrane receptor protein
MNKLSNSLLPIVLAAVPLSFAQLSNAEQNNGVATKKTTGFATPELDKVVISAHSFDQGQHEMSQPATLLTDEDLDRQRANSLGETLSKQVGIHNSSYGTAVGRPVIRGMSGARVKVLQDGIDSLDASAVSPDHSINVDTFGAQKVEVLRGPATLMYGSGAFGGVVNVVDSRVPTGLEESETSLSMQYDTVNEGKTLGFRNNGFTDLADGNELHWKISGSHFRSDEYELPKLKASHEEHHDHHEGETEAEHAEHENHEEHANDDVLANSDTAYNNQLAIGSSYVFGSGYVGLAISQSKSEYGLPGHVHHDEHEHEGDGARIKMRQQRIDLDSRWDQPTAGIESVKFRLGFNDYRHDEVEGGEVVTEFRRKGYEGRTEVLLSPIADISQALGLQFSQDTFKSGNASENSGELAVPETDSATVGAFWLGKTQLAGWGVELGTRLEQAQISPDSPAAINASCGALTVNGYEDKKFNTHSASLGVLRDLDFAAMNDWQFTASVTSAQRAPTAQELFSCGAHGATQTFDLGNPDLDVEQALNFELGLRKIQGRLTTGLNLYQNNINDYIYAQNTGLEVNGYGQYQYVQSDVKFIGAEVDAAYQLLQGLTLTAMADRVRADDLPRIPADRIGMGFELSTMALFSSAPDWMVFGKWQQVQKQDQVADNEESSLGYDLVSLGMSYQAVLPNSEYRIDLKANNLLDEEIRQHTSFVKEQAPQPGRNISLGVAVTF